LHLRPDLEALSARLRAPPVTRFAPAPTGRLHLGHVVNAIYVWGVAQALGGQVIFRIEDHDRIRCRLEYDAAIVEDMAWLGFVPDEAPTSVVRQSEAPHRYSSALTTLERTAHVYACACSRADVGGAQYPGTCRTRGLGVSPGHGLRVRLGPERETFEDALLGSLEQVPAVQCGDLLVRDRDGHWTYHFSVTVDDLREGVSLVIRGTDLAESTGRQIALGRMLGRAAPPVFLHHPLVLDRQGRKLSKSAGDTGVRALRESGVSAAEVIGLAAAAVGLIDHPAPVLPVDLPALFAPVRP
jgi:glutamyl-tRNA synthetase/glutamyl-Q tRNA(Asp) synthetase